MIQNDGKILGRWQSLDADTNTVLARYNADGTLDTTYGNGGLANLLAPSSTDGMWIEDMDLTSDGKVLAAMGVNGTVYFPRNARHGRWMR